jgi:hypothetical protein
MQTVFVELTLKPTILGLSQSNTECDNCISKMRAFGAVMSHRDETSDAFRAQSEAMSRRLSHAKLVIIDHIVLCPTRKHGANFCTCTAAYCINLLASEFDI